MSVADGGAGGEVGDTGEPGSDCGDSRPFDELPSMSSKPLKPKLSGALAAGMAAAWGDSKADLGLSKVVEPKADDAGFEAEAATLALVNAEASSPRAGLALALNAEVAAGVPNGEDVGD